MSEMAPRQLILTLYGLYAREEHNWLSVRSVVKLLGDLGVDSAGVRSSISRLKRRDVLHAMKDHGAAGYALSAQVVEVLREGDVRIFDRARATTADGFLLIVYSIPESEREKRHQLRAALSRMGVGTAAPGVWVAPGHLRDEVTRTLERLDMQSYVDLFHSRYEAFGSLPDKVGQWWDLDGIDSSYADFIGRYTDARTRWSSSTDETRAAFEVYVPMLTDWRRLPYLDPGLPLELLPVAWNGSAAAALFTELDTLLRAPAREHALSVIHAQT